MFDTSFQYAQYGLDAWLVSPPWSAMLGLSLLLGCDYLGKWLLKILGFSVEKPFSKFRMQAILAGTMGLAIILYPLVLFQKTPLVLLQAVAWLIVILGIINFYKLLNHFVANRKEIFTNIKLKGDENIVISIVLLIIGSLLLLALGPVTNADSLDYHMGVAIDILNQGGMPYSPEWFTSRLAGNGEVLNALGLAIGTEQFGSLIQWGSLVGIAALVWPRKEHSEQYAFQSIVLLATVCSPVLLFLISAPKPQLWPIAMTTLAFYLFTTPKIENTPDKKIYRQFTFACMLCMCAAQAKLNYLLGGGLAGCLAFFIMLKGWKVMPTIMISALTAVLIMLPALVWKVLVFDATLFESLVSPMPGNIPGTGAAIASWSNAADFFSRFPFPLSIILPDSFGSISVVLGLGWVFLIFQKPKITKATVVPMIAILLLVIVNIFLAPRSARVYLEPYFWCLILCTQSAKEHRMIYPAVLSWVVKLQALAFLIITWFGIITLFPGALNKSWRSDIMVKSANGYEVMRWADEVLPEDAVLLNRHRSMAQAPRQAFNYFQWTRFVDPSSPEGIFYLDRIKEVKASHVLIIGVLFQEE